MNAINLIETAKTLPKAWSSMVLATLGGTNFKILRMDEQAYVNESHSYDEVLLVIDGQLNLTINDQLMSVKSGEAYTVPANTPHAVTHGSFGTLLILDSTEQSN